MALNLDVVGMEHKYSRTFVVGREQIREFAKAIKCDNPVSQDLEAAAEAGHDGLMAPVTFSAVMALLVQKEFFRVHDFGVDTMQIVQTDQRFVFHKPLKEGDELSCWFVVETHKESFGVDIVTSRNVVRNQEGEMVLEAFTTLMGRDSEAMADIKLSL
ncbi:UPF0336 protein [Mycolicibacterium insubricum]|jgi:acyl dehydratase|uniref:UPF0336 protein BST26_14420 n=1 Tax=Mycolicibacterium insubricum TaxID=444597 RepID=A0A1X0D7Z4_9MYCO|nr:MaoC family dehydratase N-terminal domain-containing protein [Mycolicibacterium insubricum]MCB9440836.1 MaoC family dehydratase N-terminal domain-containing protein [Mycolicibacterium sp.]MCV7081265.1 MaoC family dehydratase N-terminal domain-containing protein [Mycolicibacterium insubricum]ORA68536.1 3-hydroxyacyl-ACP dehydratase [Mycolicibacterium insubricum]BBZ65852.1 UPF0336 protein [Mycolicibacterium insubricum]